MYNIYSSSYKPNQDNNIKRVKRKKSISFLTYLIIDIFIIIFIIIFLNKAWFFQIQGIEINSNLLSDVEHIKTKGSNSDNKIYDNVNKEYTNVLFASAKSIKKYLQKNFLEISNIEVKKDLFKRKIYISYSFREPKYTWCDYAIKSPNSDSDNCFLIDNNGLLFKKDNIKDKNILLIKNEYYQDLELSQKIPNNVLYIVNNFSSILENKNIYLREAIIKNNNLIVFVLDILDAENNLKNTIEARFSLEKDLDEQLEKSSSLINYLSDIDLEKVKYIDLRVKEKIYYK